MSSLKWLKEFFSLRGLDSRTLIPNCKGEPNFTVAKLIGVNSDLNFTIAVLNRVVYEINQNLLRPQFVNSHQKVLFSNTKSILTFFNLAS